jgi:ZIP family zinc transporter
MGLAESWMPAHPIAQGLVAGVFIVLLNMAGALLVLLLRQPTERVLDTLLGFAAGVMLAASFTSLILPAIEWGGALPALLGVALGALAMDAADHLIPPSASVYRARGTGWAPHPRRDSVRDCDHAP